MIGTIVPVVTIVGSGVLMPVVVTMVPGVVESRVRNRWVSRGAGNPTPRMGYSLALSTELPALFQSADASSIRGHRRPPPAGVLSLRSETLGRGGVKSSDRGYHEPGGNEESAFFIFHLTLAQCVVYL